MQEELMILALKMKITQAVLLLNIKADTDRVSHRDHKLDSKKITKTYLA